MVSRAREDFHRHASLTDAAARADALTVGLAQLDNIAAQAAHLRSIMQRDMLVHRGGLVEWRRDEEATRRLELQQQREQQERKRRMQSIRKQQLQQQRSAPQPAESDAQPPQQPALQSADNGR